MPLFTHANARAMADKAKLARRDKRAAQAQELAHLRAQVQSLQAELSAAMTDKPSRLTEDYAGSRLSQVREQLDRITALLAKETDPLSVERLARAMAALSTQEFNLSGRPLPGSLRPTAAAARKSADYRNTLTAPPAPAPINPFRRAAH